MKIHRSILFAIPFVFVISASLFYLLYLGKIQPKIEEVTLRPVLVLGREEDDPHQAFYNPSIVRADRWGNIYVVDRGNNRIVKFDKDGKFLKEIGGIGQGPGEFLEPVDVIIDQEGRLFVADKGNLRIQIFDPDGHFLKSFKIRSISYALDGGVLALDSQGRIYISSPTERGIITVYSPEGNELANVGHLIPTGFGKRRDITWNQVYLGIDGNDNIYVLFFSYPIIRKYNRNYALVFEKDISYLPDVKASLRSLERDLRKPKNPYTVYGMFGGFAVLDNGEFFIDSGRVYRFNPLGEPIQRIDCGGISGISAAYGHLFGVISSQTEMLALKYPLP